MPVFPVPVFSAVLLALFALHLMVGARRVGVVAVVILACAAQAAIVALVQHYGVAALRPVQPVTACLIPALAFVAFRATGQHSGLRGAAALHLAAPLLALAAVLFMPALIDAIVFAAFAGYGMAILLALRHGPDALPGARLSAGSAPAAIWRLIAGVLLVSALSDGVIVAVQVAGRPHLQPLVITASTGIGLAILGWLLLSREIEPDETPTEAQAQAQPRQADPDLMPRIRALMETERPYLDPDLSLGRLARRLGVPAKEVSVAINADTGANVSRFVNDYRIAAACRALEAGETVTEAMLSSGFYTKSNFNREFKRVTGKTPSGFTAMG